MGIVAKYRFDPTIYADYMPEFNSDFYEYYVSSDVKNDDGTITRTIECYTTPTLMRFGQIWADGESGATDKSLSLLEVYECDTSNITSMNSMFRWCTNLILLDTSNFNVCSCVKCNLIKPSSTSTLSSSIGISNKILPRFVIVIKPTSIISAS